MINIQTKEPKCGWTAYNRRKDLLKAIKDAILGATLIICLLMAYVIVCNVEVI